MDRSILNSINDQAGLTAVPGSPVLALNVAMPYIFGAFGILLLINIVVSGFKIMSSQGDPKSLQEAQVKLKNSGVGLLVIFTSYWIVKFIMQFLGIQISDLFM